MSPSLDFNNSVMQDSTVPVCCVLWRQYQRHSETSYKRDVSGDIVVMSWCTGIWLPVVFHTDKETGWLECLSVKRVCFLDGTAKEMSFLLKGAVGLAIAGGLTAILVCRR